MKLGRSDDFGQLFHIRWFDIHDVEALVLYVEIPEIDAEIVTAYEGLSITVDRDAVDVVRMGVCVGASRYSGHDSIVMGQARKLQILGILEVGEAWTGTRGSASRTQSIAGCEVV